MTKIGGALIALALFCAACQKDHDDAHGAATAEDGVNLGTPSGAATTSDARLDSEQNASAQAEDAGSNLNDNVDDAGTEDSTAADESAAVSEVTTATAGAAAPANASQAANAGTGGSASNSSELGCSGACGLGILGATCEQDDDCVTGYACRVAEILTDANGNRQELRACARPCAPDGDQCLAGEKCQTLTGDADQYLCLRIWNVPFALCGASVTSACSGGLECKRIPSDQSYGQCVQPCQLSSSDQTSQCPDDYTCQDLLDDPGVGVCTRTAPRGWPCGTQFGLSCAPEDLCISEGSVARCYQNCTGTFRCDDRGQLCRRLDADTRYCDDL